MKIHQIIRARRQALGLTQEQLAGKLGVSAPAVNKWERGNSYPDITLLPVLARTLGVDLNTLLSFQEDLTEREIGEFLNRLHQEGRQRGCAAAFALAEEKLREFPGSDRLAYSAAGLLEGILALYPGGDEAERTVWQGKIDALYDRVLHSADARLREWAAYTAANRCMGRGELDRAEELLSGLSDTHRSKREALASLRRRQGRTEEGWTLLERELFDRAHAIESILLTMADWAMEEGDRDRGHGLTDTAERAGEVLDLSDYAVVSAPFQLAVAERAGPRALALLERLFCSLTAPWDLSGSLLYRHLNTKEDAGEGRDALIPCLLEQIEADPDCAFLRELPEYAGLTARWRPKA